LNPKIPNKPLSDFRLKQSARSTARSSRLNKSASGMSSNRNLAGMNINPLNLVPIEQKRNPSFSIGQPGMSSFYSPSVDPPFLLPI